MESTKGPPLAKNGEPRESSAVEESAMGRRLRELGEKALASGLTILTEEQIRQRIADARGGSVQRG